MFLPMLVSGHFPSISSTTSSFPHIARSIPRCLHPSDVSEFDRRLRPQYCNLAETVVSELWSGFVIPWFESGENRMPHEGNMFLRQLFTSPLQQSVQKHIAADHDDRSTADLRKERHLSHRHHVSPYECGTATLRSTRTGGSRHDLQFEKIRKMITLVKTLHPVIETLTDGN